MFEYFVLFLLGAVVGSFLNVVVLRHIKREGYIGGRSKCFSCQKILSWFELVPIFSFLIQKGKCRTCRTSLSVQYPLVELGTGLLFLATYFHFKDCFETTALFVIALILHLIAWSLLVVITVYDYHTKLIPNVFSYTFALIAFLGMFFEDGLLTVPTVLQVLAGPVLFLPFYLLWKVSDGRWLGLGDGKLAFGMGWFLGMTQGLSAIMMAFWIGASISLSYIAFQKIVKRGEKNKLTLKSEIPFGPYLVIGTALAYFFEINLYATMGVL